LLWQPAAKPVAQDPHALESRKIAATTSTKNSLRRAPQHFSGGLLPCRSRVSFFAPPDNPHRANCCAAHPFGRIVSANSDLTGIMDRRASIQEARQTVGQIVEQISA